MSELVRRNSHQLPTEMPRPRCSGGLAMAMKNILEPHPDIWPAQSHEAEVIAEAKSILLSMASFMRQVTPEVVALWLEPILAGVRTERKSETFEAWFAAVMLMAKDLPLTVFNERTQQDALRTIKYFPSAADIYEALAPTYRPMATTMRALKKIAETPSHEEFQQIQIDRSKKFQTNYDLEQAKLYGADR